MSRHRMEFDQIVRALSNLALSEAAKEMARSLEPTLQEAVCKSRQKETTGAKTILESQGSPPLSSMRDIRKTLLLVRADAMLSPEQLVGIAEFLHTVKRAKGYLKRAEMSEETVSRYGNSLFPLESLAEEIDSAITGDQVVDQASPELKSIRRRIEAAREAVKAKLENMLRSRRECFSESFIVTRGDRYALPVKKECKSQIQGTVIDISSSGNTVFIEPTQARKLTDELSELSIAEDNEVRRVLYTLTARVESDISALLTDIECMEALDFLFAKARLSLSMDGVPPVITTERRIVIRQGRHPLIDKKACVPLDFEMGGLVRGVVITGPNTGGKTVALKTVGLLSLMAQSGLHIPAEAGSVLSMHANTLCDIGDGQSIAENLSTFSSHMTNIIGILSQAGPESLVLLDELGSGTDPAEGMGLAIAILRELSLIGCLFVATSHYPEVKEYAKNAEGMINARMTFDPVSLMPLYQLKMGEAGESCALSIAKRLGMPEHMLAIARTAAYGTGSRPVPEVAIVPAIGTPLPKMDERRVRPEEAKPALRRCDRFQVGDSVRVYPQKEIGIVYRRADEKGMVGVQVKAEKLLVNHKRVQIMVAAEALYPDDYDFSIVLDTVANRKARKQQMKGHRPEAIVRYEAGEEPNQ